MAHWLLLASGLFVSSLCVHEYAHYCYLRQHRISLKLIQYGMRVYLEHPPLKPAAERTCALLGPACGALYCLLFAAIGWAGQWPSLVTTAGLVACYHGTSLLPGQPDYQSLRASPH